MDHKQFFPLSKYFIGICHIWLDSLNSGLQQREEEKRRWSEGGGSGRREGEGNEAARGGGMVSAHGVWSRQVEESARAVRFSITRNWWCESVNTPAGHRIICQDRTTDPVSTFKHLILTFGSITPALMFKVQRKGGETTDERPFGGCFFLFSFLWDVCNWRCLSLQFVFVFLRKNTCLLSRSFKRALLTCNGGDYRWGSSC